MSKENMVVQPDFFHFRPDHFKLKTKIEKKYNFLAILLISESTQKYLLGDPLSPLIRVHTKKL